jgi:tetratricopeptide (TPR) repeat protein
MQKADMQYAYSLLENNKKMEAADIFEKVIYSNPDNSRAHLELAIIYHQTNDFINAMYHYRKYGRLEPDSQKVEMIKDQLSLAKKEFIYLQNEKALRRKHKETPKEATTNSVTTNVVQVLKEQNIQLTEEVETLNNKVNNLEKTIQSQAKVLRNRQKKSQNIQYRRAKTLKESP